MFEIERLIVANKQEALQREQYWIDLQVKKLNARNSIEKHESRIIYGKNYYENNKEYFQNYNKNYRKNNKEYFNNNSKIYYEKNKEKISLKNKEIYYQKKELNLMSKEDKN